MEDRLRMFINSVKKEGNKEKKDKLIKIDPVNFEEFSIKLVGNRNMDLTDMVKLYEWVKETLNIKAGQVEFFQYYHPNSPCFWMKDIEKLSEIGEKDDKPVMGYTVGLDLEQFMKSENQIKQKEKISEMGFYIPDNYELTEKVIKEFNEETKGKYKDVIEDNSYRETAMWESEDKEAILALGNYINNKYVLPAVKQVLESFGAKDAKFTKTQLDFIYE